MLFNALANMCIKYIHPLVSGNPPMIEQFQGRRGSLCKGGNSCVFHQTAIDGQAQKTVIKS